MKQWDVMDWIVRIFAVMSLCVLLPTAFYWRWYVIELQPGQYKCEVYKYDVSAKECTFAAPVNRALVLDEIEPGMWQGYLHSPCAMTLVTLNKATGMVERSNEWLDRGCESEPTVKAKMHAR